MRPGFRLTLAVAFYFALGTSAHADLPLTIENLITDKGQTKLNLTIAYYNNDNAIFGMLANNQDVLSGSLSLRYGLTGQVELYGCGGYLYSHVRTSHNNGVRIITSHQFTEAWVGINYQFKEDDETPAWLGFAKVAGLEKNEGALDSFKSWRVGVTSYRAVDPVVFSLSANLWWNLSRKLGSLNYRPGPAFSINPAVDFSVNDRVTLTTGMQWKIQLADNSRIGYDRTSTDLELGVSYVFSEKNIAQIVLLSNMSGNRGALLQLNWQNIF